MCSLSSNKNGISKTYISGTKVASVEFEAICISTVPSFNPSVTSRSFPSADAANSLASTRPGAASLRTSTKRCRARDPGSSAGADDATLIMKTSGSPLTQELTSSTAASRTVPKPCLVDIAPSSPFTETCPESTTRLLGRRLSAVTQLALTGRSVE